MQPQGRNTTRQKVCPSHCFGFSMFWSVPQVGCAATRLASPGPARRSGGCHTEHAAAPGRPGRSSPFHVPASSGVSLQSHFHPDVLSFIPASCPTRSCFPTCPYIHLKASPGKIFSVQPDPTFHVETWGDSPCFATKAFSIR